MNGAHDVGGVLGFGPVVSEPDEPVFSADWERQAFAIAIASLCQGVAAADENRNAIERMGNVAYLSTSYYEHWLVAMEKLLVQKGIIDEQERVERVRAFLSGRSLPSRESVPDDGELARTVRDAIATGGPSVRETGATPKFAIGDEVVTTPWISRTHTRLPGYARGKRGTIIAYHGSHVLPDSRAHLRGENPEPLYTVRFDAHDLWGDEAEAQAGCVHLDLWESYLIERTSDGENMENSRS
ncbi:nitrile hydratase subunit beta [Nonomuraea cavernae]|uniref:Nitrile hydratase subunit beta n=1 Tax=Nonomuraea cavernae TaxID=2045107 RepID=A0A917ZD16_9ACTN|nr:nitrile hydratase subunit beta [Nonomuraea cavernae]MCA2190143.1 nitrile hydratase subunit beta [Nonomuraea cavernae]GGO81080.1 low-molecular weight cobalt-containing nitrile hydratase subunit beta [Nonomuraea cavernae]